MENQSYIGNFFDQYGGKRLVPVERPDFLETLEASSSQSFVGSVIRLWNTPDFEEEPDFEPMRDKRFSPNGRLRLVRSRFSGARSSAELEHLIKRYDEEISTLQTLNWGVSTYGVGLSLILQPILFHMFLLLGLGSGDHLS